MKYAGEKFYEGQCSEVKISRVPALLLLFLFLVWVFLVVVLEGECSSGLAGEGGTGGGFDGTCGGCGLRGCYSNGDSMMAFMVWLLEVIVMVVSLWRYCRCCY